MITFLQEKLQKHYKWLLCLLLVLISFSFIFVYSASSGFSKTKPKFHFYGFNLYDTQVQKRIFEGAGLSLYLHTGQTLKQEKDLQELGFARASLLHLADTLGVPEPTEADLKTFIQALPLFQMQDGSFNGDLYKEFQVEIESQLGGGLAYQILTDDYRLQGIEKLLTGPSYVENIEIEGYLKQFHALWSVRLAKLKGDSHKGNVAKQNEIEEFYKKNIHTYSTPPKVCISYICFDGMAREEAESKAHELVYELYEANIGYHTEAFKKSLQSRKLSLLKVDAFAIDQLPENTPFPKEVLEAVLNLDESSYYTSPFTVGERVYVLFLDTILAPETLPFAAVKEQVCKDCQAEKDRNAFEAYAREVDAQLSPISQANTFKTQAEALGLECVDHLSFKLSNPPAALGLGLASQIRNLKEGSVSGLVFHEQDAVWVYILKKEMLPVGPEDPEWRLASQQLETLVTFSRLQSSIAELVARGLPAKP